MKSSIIILGIVGIVRAGNDFLTETGVEDKLEKKRSVAPVHEVPVTHSERIVQIPSVHTFAIPVQQPYHVPVQVPVAVASPTPVEVPVPVPYEKTIPLPVDLEVPYPVERPVPVPLIRNIPVPAVSPYPVPVPVYKTQIVDHGTRVRYENSGGWSW